MLTEEDEKLAKEYADKEQDVRPWSIAYCAVLYGIEHERKRRINFVELDPESMDALMKELKAQPHGTIRSLEEFRKTYFPIQQVGEKHWRIKG